VLTSLITRLALNGADPRARGRRGRRRDDLDDTWGRAAGTTRGGAGCWPGGLGLAVTGRLRREAVLCVTGGDSGTRGPRARRVQLAQVWTEVSGR
jgi:hypothetical protein